MGKPTREIIATDQAPAAVGAYSQAVLVSGGRTLYTSGQVAFDPATGQLVGEGDVVAEAQQVMKNLAAVLAAAGMDFADVVRATIFLADIGDFGAVNEVYASHFTGNPPARVCVQAGALPKGARVEIDFVAVGE